MGNSLGEEAVSETSSTGFEIPVASTRGQVGEHAVVFCTLRTRLLDGLHVVLQQVTLKRIHGMAFSVSRLCFCVIWVAVMLGVGVHCDDTDSLLGAYAPGDIIIGILGSVHSTVKDLQTRISPDKYTCTDFDLIPFVESLAVIHTIENINDSGFLPGIRLGYLMCDACAYGTKALQCVEHMLSINMSLPVRSDYLNFYSPVKAFLGERYSELSIPVAKLLSLYMIPQVQISFYAIYH
ncbi:hypothetical protein MHYP_G00061310 [Metynnis hypsauchen]